MAIDFTFPSSDAFPVDEFHLRRALVGGTLARAWVAWVDGATLRAVSFRHNGSGADPRSWEPALAGAEWAEADLGSGNVLASDVAAAFVTAAGTLGSTWSRVGATASRGSATGALLGPSMPSATTERGMRGVQRLNFGGDDTGFQNGNTGGTGSVHVTSPGTGRVLGVYIRGRFRSDNASDFQPRLAFGVGPVYSLDPGSITIRGQGQLAAPLVDNEIGVVLFAEPAAIDASDSCWVVFRDVGGQLCYRDHGNTIEGQGDLVALERLIWDSTITNDPTVAIPSSYNPTADAGFQIYPHVGLIFELADGDGSYPADGSIDTWVGDLRSGAGTAADGGSLQMTQPVDMVDEAVGFRFALPNWTAVQLTQQAIAIAAWVSTEDVGLAYYTFNDTAIPSATSNPRLANIGAIGTTATGWNVHTIDTPLDVGIDDLGTDPILGVFVNAGARNGAGTLSTLQIYFHDETNGQESWPTAWVDNGREWDDRIAPYASPSLAGTANYPMLGPITEYRTRSSVGSGNPTGNPNDVWPDPLSVDDVGGAGSIDDGPRNLMAMRFRLQRGAITAVETPGEVSIHLIDSGARTPETGGLTIELIEPAWMAAFNANPLPFKNE